jgi:hypothetical protein
LQDYQQPQYYNHQGDGSTQSKNIDVPNSKVQQFLSFTFCGDVTFGTHYSVWSKSLMFVVLWLQVGLIIGKGGETIKYLQQQSGARIQVARDADSDPRLSTRQVEIMGSAEQISHAEQLVRDVIAEVRLQPISFLFLCMLSTCFALP